MTLSLHERCMDAAVTKIQTLTITPPWTTQNVFKRKFPWNRDALASGVDAALFVTPFNVRQRQVLNQSDDYDCGVQITAALKTNLSLTEGMSDVLSIRQQLERAFLPQAGAAALAGVTEVYNVLVEQGPVIDPASFERMYDVSAFVIRCIARVTRA